MARSVSHTLVASSLVAVALVLAAATFTVPGASRARAEGDDAIGKFVGASECKKCHEKGMQGRPADKWPQLKENATWASKDQHAFAFRRLDDEDAPKPEWRSKITSEAIFEKLEGAEADMASESVKCLSCHGVVVHGYGQPKWLPKDANRVVFANEDLQQGYSAKEGVSCDGCHGPASGWLKDHEKEDWAIEEWKKRGGEKNAAAASQKLWEDLGLYYSKDLVLWANQCVRCHLRIDSPLLDAKHPDLEAFELWDQNNRVPPHWRDYTKAEDKPYLPGAGAMHPARVWQVGQAAALVASLEQVAERAGAEEPNEKHVETAVERASSHYTVLRHALAAQAGCGEAAKALAAAMTAMGEAEDAEGKAKAAKAALKAMEPVPYAMAGAKLDKATVGKILAAIEGDADAKKKGMHDEVRKLSLIPLKKAQ